MPAPNYQQVLAGALTPEQLAAAMDPANEVLALACAGSGKSMTLAYRMARLLAEGNDPSGVVAFTFTEKAADAIKLRAVAALRAVGLDPTKVGAMYVGTIHAYCQRVLEQMDARYRQFDVLDENRLKLYVMSRYPQLDVVRLRNSRPNRGYFDVVDKLCSAWLLANDELMSLDEIERQDADLGTVLKSLGQRMAIDQYIDFSMMIRLVVDALDQAAPAAEVAVRRLDHLMVDEYQDVNPSQEALIRLLHARSQSLFVVGDDDQSIYSWRGADVSNILSFTARYPAATEHSLATNFRSTRAIVESAESFAAAELGATRIAKAPTAARNLLPNQFGVMWFDDRPTEASWIAARIGTLLATGFEERDGTSRGLTLGDFAILMRSTRTEEGDGRPRHAAFTDALDAVGIRYSLEAGGAIFDRPEVAAMRAAFESLRNGNPDRRTVRALFDVTIAPAFPDADFNEITRVIAEWGRNIHAPITGTRRRIYPQALVHELLAAFGVSRGRIDPGALHDLGVFSRILQDVETVYLSIDTTSRFQDILNFLGNAAESGYNSATSEVVQRPDVVTISTVHKMKGLEFPVVFVADVENRRFPRDRGGYDGWIPGPLMAPAITRGAYQATRAEEARLFFTAITRPERYLYVTGSQQLPGGKQRRTPSPFAQRLTDPDVSNDPAQLPAGLAPATPRRRLDETVVPTTYSQIRYYLRCPKDYQFRNIYGFSPPIVDLFGYGQTVHAAVGKLHEEFPTSTPTPDQAAAVARDIFHLKHIPPSRDPVGSPGGYERAKQSAEQILSDYATGYASDFTHRRQVELPFEVPVLQGVISGSIDLMIHEDSAGNIVDTTIIDFKAMETGPALEWTELSLQVQLYAKAAVEVLGDNARTGAVHLLKDGNRVEIPVDAASTDAAVANVEWAIDRILASDFPMRPYPSKCEDCDFKLLCPQQAELFRSPIEPPEISIPGGHRKALAFSQVTGP